MVRKIIWSGNAKSDKIEILKYWVARNKSNTYSKTLDKLFKEAVNLISKNPGIGHLTNKENVKVKITRDYLIVYEVTDDTVYILAIFDGRRNPEEFQKRI
ncbi:MAG: type toxin-antitoxin system RelE/ParE family toxin [Ferruginibacter sp.]|nr:type toxin-antitoxin system RelE/ParE family toxin [Ferruginibacter sp.]